MASPAWVADARPLATPAARARARELGIDLATVLGTGRHGAIRLADVEEATALGPVRPPGPPVARPATPATPPSVTPRARRRAAELGVDPATVVGTGFQGAVTGDDVEAAAARGAATDAPATPREEPPSRPQRAVPGAPDAARADRGPAEAAAAGRTAADRASAMRRAIAAAMAKSKREIPHYYLSLWIDVEPALSWLERTNEARPLPERILPTALLLRAAALAARDVPELNGFWTDDGFEPADAVHLGVGISLRQGGLIAPAIHDAATKSLPEVMADLRDLVGRTRSLQLRSSEMTDATITVTALGDRGVDTVLGVIYPPQVALVGFGRVVERVHAEDGRIDVRRMVHASLAADHRASDGHRGAIFLNAVAQHLQRPEEL